MRRTWLIAAAAALEVGAVALGLTEHPGRGTGVGPETEVALRICGRGTGEG